MSDIEEKFSPSDFPPELILGIYELITVIPDNIEMSESISRVMKRIPVMRQFWKAVLGEESLNWNHSVNRNCIKKFFKRNSMLDFYNRSEANNFAMLLMVYEHFSYCTSVEWLIQKYEDQPELHRFVPEIVRQNIEKIVNANLFCKTAIISEMNAKEIYSTQLTEKIGIIFPKLEEYFLQEGAMLQSA